MKKVKPDNYKSLNGYARRRVNRALRAAANTTAANTTTANTTTRPVIRTVAMEWGYNNPVTKVQIVIMAAHALLALSPVFYYLSK